MYVMCIIVAVIYFIILNRFVNIYYFGCAGISSVFIGCFFFAAVTVGILAGLLQYIIPGLIILAIISWLSKKRDQKDGSGEQKANGQTDEQMNVDP